MQVAAGEADLRAQPQHLHGAGDQDLARLGARGDRAPTWTARPVTAAPRRSTSPVVRLNRAVATRFALGPQAALAEVDPLAADLDAYRLFHAVRAGPRTDLGRPQEARLANERA